MGTELEEDVFLTTKQAAEFCHRTEERMRTLAGDGRVPAVMVAHQWRFSRRDLEDIMTTTPEILYARRTPVVVAMAAVRESRRATMLRLNATQDRHAAARRGLDGLKRKLALQNGLDYENQSAENQRSIQMLYEAHMADVRSKKVLARKPMTTEERIALLTKRPVGEEGPICYGCWREHFGRPPFSAPHQPCERHQREHEEFAAQIRGETQARLREAS